MVQDLNNFITQKKERSSALTAKAELMAESSSRGPQKPLTGECIPATSACYRAIVMHASRPAMRYANNHVNWLATMRSFHCLPQHQWCP